MEVANFSLCRELYELSALDDKSIDHDNIVIERPGAIQPLQVIKGGGMPRYDLGYLVRKLNGHGGLELRTGDKGNIANNGLFHAEADTPENAVTKLCIELFKSGVLQKAA